MHHVVEEVREEMKMTACRQGEIILTVHYHILETLNHR